MEFVFLRGLGRDKRHWGSFGDTLIKQIPQAIIHYIDVPGNGDYSGQASPTTMTEYSQHCQTVLSKLTDRPVHIVSLSMGAMIALEWVQRAPDNVLSLSLINTSVANLTPFYNRINIATLLALMTKLLLSSSAEKIEKSVFRATCRTWKEHPDVLKDWVAFHKENPSKVTNIFRQLKAASRFKLENKIDTPSLVINGKQDALVNPEASKDLSRYLNCDLIRHPNAGHDLPLDAPEWLAQQIGRFVTKLSSNC